MALVIGRIRRISLDAGTPTNYTLQATTTYDATAPAENPSSWGSAAALAGMDQLLSVPSATAVEVTGNMGALVTFERFPKYMTGVIVKVRPTYDADFGQDPYLEYWTYDGVAAAWALRRSVALSNGFEGVQSGRLKYFDFRTDARLENVTAVWITLNEGAVAGSTLSWFAVHVFGACDKSPAGGGGGGGTIDLNDPGCTSSDCIDPDPCEGQPESCAPTEDTCRELAIQYGYDPDICELTPDPDWNVPELPLIDFCDPVAMAAFRATLTPLQLSWLEELLAAVELPCLDEDNQPDDVSPVNEDPDDPGEPLLPAQPVEAYVDPEDLNPPGTDPDPRAADEPPPDQNVQTVHYWWFITDGPHNSITNDGQGGRSWFVSNYTAFSPEIVDAWDNREDDFIVAIDSPGPANTGINIEFFSKIVGTRVGVRMVWVGNGALHNSGPPSFTPIVENFELVKLSKDVQFQTMVNTQQGVFATPVSVSSQDTLGQDYYNMRMGAGDTEFDLRLSGSVVITPGVYGFPKGGPDPYAVPPGSSAISDGQGWLLVTLLIRTPISSGVADFATNATMYGGGGA